ncbi:MAG: TetR/AcrR family transcriptional regulator [Solirubrobacterales bacterium]|nr:TetR/AcrR family transcriptional regulator [Solirubrobacterales bacterium]
MPLVTPSQPAGTAARNRASEAASRVPRREAILEAGVAIFGSVPYDEVSIDDIVERAGVAHGLVFHYFSNKRGLYLAVLRRTAEDLLRVHTPPSESRSPGHLVRIIINRHLDFLEHHPETLQAFLRGGIGADSEARQIVEKTRWDGIQQVLDVLEIDNPSPAIRMAMRGWAGFLDEAMIYRLEHDARVARKRLVDMGVEVLVSTLVLARGRQTRSGRDPRELLSAP